MATLVNQIIPKDTWTQVTLDDSIPYQIQATGHGEMFSFIGAAPPSGIKNGKRFMADGVLGGYSASVTQIAASNDLVFVFSPYKENNIIADEAL